MRNKTVTNSVSGVSNLQIQLIGDHHVKEASRAVHILTVILWPKKCEARLAVDFTLWQLGIDEHAGFLRDQ